ncbi:MULTISPECIES: 4Fe-4S dicluster domain-containing protein [Peptoniphilus]|mgnify:CR=1 FL=1|uniref:4Fe-4S binding domain protein n=1 Tax=Peptoniphilus duerdenii ATCC BAA-1640 TaxID=862517 RepID=E0NL21_9FIRM|nr:MULTISPECIES: 4Fe-4S binding protein [Peptoniphilus]EFM25524.1 4Fe-4S binding domain protein [Peptoniphilus duerdenii ATCC BAA-1640]ERT64666.1 4Fe-4S binding domain protein [Peptoniphilus sp. BV3AC2]MDK8276554.1 4Fe-4S binding protein [Peptoniphilus duerdenii]
MAKGRVEFNESRCKGCGLCVIACPKNVIEIDPHKINGKGYSPATAARPEDCIACQNCAITCPDSVISVIKIG